MTGTGPKVAVLYNAPILDRGHPDSVAEADVVEAAQAVWESLSRGGIAAHLLPVCPPVRSVLQDLERLAPDVVFNLVEGFGGRSAGATNLTGLLELLGLPFTGSTAEALALCQSKGRAQALLRGSGLPTAPGLLAEPGRLVPAWEGPWPVIVKPDAEDASLGIDQGSVLGDQGALAARVARLQESYGAALVEAYLPGPEFNVGIVALPAPEPLPIAEVVYSPGPGSWPILTYDSKWKPGSAEDLASVVRCPAPIDPVLSDRLADLALRAFRATRCRDYARVDVRLDAQGEPMILEVNPNPDISPGAGWARALGVAGYDYASTVAALVRQAWERAGDRERL